MSLKIEIKGDKAMIDALRKASKETPEAAAGALYKCGFELDADMVARIPVDTGRLRATHYVAPPTMSGDTVAVEVGVGTDYAVAVHERTESFHAVGEAKFLERALNAYASRFLQRLAMHTAVLLKTGGGVRAIPARAPTKPAADGRGGRTKRGS